MTEFTFFEIHLHDGLSFSATNTAPAIGGSGGDGASEDDFGNGEGNEADSETGGESGRLRIGALVALLLLVALAAAVKYLRGDGDVELTELDDFADE